MIEKIKQIDQKLEETCTHFIADSSAFIGLITEELKKFRKTAKKYNQLASVARFGTLGSISFDLKYREQYNELKKFQSRLFQAEQDEELLGGAYPASFIVPMLPHWLPPPSGGVVLGWG